MPEEKLPISWIPWRDAPSVGCPGGDGSKENEARKGDGRARRARSERRSRATADKPLRDRQRTRTSRRTNDRLGRRRAVSGTAGEGASIPRCARHERPAQTLLRSRDQIRSVDNAASTAVSDAARRTSSDAIDSASPSSSPRLKRTNPGDGPPLGSISFGTILCRDF